MTRIVYSREELLALSNQPNRPAPANLPEALRRLPLISTLFNNRVGFCKPMDLPGADENDLNPGAPAVTVR